MDVDAVLDGDPYVTHHPQGRPFWRAAADGVFLLPRCRGCGRSHWYPRPFCPFCGGGDVALGPASGLGRIYAFSSLRRVTPPVVVAYVRLDEGPVMLTNLVDCGLDGLRIDGRVAVSFRPAKEGRMVPVFTPVAEPRSGPALPASDGA